MWIILDYFIFLVLFVAILRYLDQYRIIFLWTYKAIGWLYHDLNFEKKGIERSYNGLGGSGISNFFMDIIING